MRRRLVFLANLEREPLPAELVEFCDLRAALRQALFGRITLDKR